MRYIYCHPLFDERKCGHRFSYQLSKTFEKNFLNLERFDYCGTGESCGKFSDITMDSLQNDLQAKIANDNVCLIGTRFGATVIIDCCCREELPVRKVVLIEPIINGPHYIEYLFKKQHLKDVMTGNNSAILPEDDFCNIEGYKTSKKFVDEIKQINFVEIKGCMEVDTVNIVQISVFPRIKVEYDLFSTQLRKNGIKNSIDIFNLPIFWERMPIADYSVLTGKIVEWCV